MGNFLKGVAAAALLCAAPLSLSAQGRERQPSAPSPSDIAETLGYGKDAVQRMTVPVTINGQGPYHFVVDSGAERTVISRELAAQLGLAAGPLVRLASIADVQLVPTVMIPRLVFGRRVLEEIQAPALDAANLGAPGMLGVDSLADQELVLDFAQQEMRLTRARFEDETWSHNTILVRGRTLLGRMVLTDASIEGQSVTVIVDTGSPVTIGNNALRERLVGSGRINPDQILQLTSVTGARVNVGYTSTRRVRIGEAGIRDLPIAFADLQLFRELELDRQPTMLIGMDVLQLFRRVAIDFARRRLRLMPGLTSDLSRPIRMASAP